MKKMFLILVAVCLIQTSCAKVKNEKAITLVYSNWETLSQQIIANKNVISAFEKKFPDIKIEYQIGTADKILIQMAGGTAPDVFFWATALDLSKLAEKNVIAELDSLIENDKDKDFRLSDYFPVSIKACKVGNRMFGFPTHLDVMTLFYNKSLFDEYKVEYPNDKWTWSDYLNAAKKLTKDLDNDGNIDIYGIYRENGELFLRFAQEGIMFYDANLTGCMFNKPETVNILQFYKDLEKKDKVSASFNTRDINATQYFFSGKIAMFIHGTWYLPELMKIKNFKWDVAPLPANPGQKRGYIYGAGMHCISSESKHKKEAWEFIKFYSGIEGRRARRTAMKMIPALREATKFPEFLNPPPKNIDVILKAIEGDNAYLEGIFSVKDELMGKAYWIGMENFLVLENQTAEQTVKNIAREAEKILRNKKKK